jgi:hypothetical protein
MSTFDIRGLLIKAEEALSIIVEMKDFDIAAIVHSVRCKIFELAQKKVAILNVERDTYAKIVEGLYPASTNGVTETCAAICTQRNAEVCANAISDLSGQLSRVTDLEQFVDPQNEENHARKDASQWVPENLATLLKLLDMPENYHERLSVLWWCIIDQILNDITTLRRASLERVTASTDDLKKLARVKPPKHAGSNLFFSDDIDRSMSMATIANINIALGAAYFESNTRIDQWLMALADLEKRAHAAVSYGFLKHSYLKCGVIHYNENHLKQADLQLLRQTNVGDEEEEEEEEEEQ